MSKKFLSIFFLIFFIASSNALAQNSASLFNSPNKGIDAKVADIINSATIRLADGQKIRLIGLIPLDKPKRKELPRNEYGIIIEQDDPIIPFEQTVYEFVVNLIKGKEIRLEFDNLYRGSDGYVLGYAFLKDGTFVNAEILREGFSDLHITPPNTKYEKELREAYQEAKKEKRGLQGN